jgi:flavin reductase
MSIEASEFRRALAHWSTGVTIVGTLLPDGTPAGMTATAFASVSLDPPLVLVCLEHTSDSHAALRSAGVFAISMLPAGTESIARRFADDATGKFDEVAWHPAESGAPLLDEALAWVDCRVHDEYEAGDHTIFVGAVLGCGARSGEPLLYYCGTYGRFTS